MKVEFGRHITIRDDVMRRDLTINALYYDIRRGKIVDTIGGLNDIKKRIVRAVGNARQRFQEDRLRILRTFRFSARNNFKIDEETSNAIKYDNRLNGISDEDDVTQERINEEFLGMLKWCNKHNDNSAWLRYLNLLKEYKMLIRMYPDIKLTLKFFKTLNDKIIYTKLFDRNKPTHNLHNKLIFDLRLSGEIADAVIFLLKIKDIFNDKNIHTLFDYDNRDLNIVFLYRNKVDFNITNEIISEYGRLEKIDKKYIDAFTNYEVTTNAKELMEMGFKGRELGIEIKRIETEKFKKLII